MTASLVMRYTPLPQMPWEQRLSFDEEAHRYHFDGVELGSTTTILKRGGANSFNPTYWRRRLMTKGLKDDEAAELLRSMVDHGTPREAAEQHVDSLSGRPLTREEAEAFMEWRRNSGARRGTLLHAAIESRLRGLPVREDSPIMPWLRQWDRFAEEEGLQQVFLCERRMVNPDGFFAATVDCCARLQGRTFDGVVCTIDWKTLFAIEKAKSEGWQAQQLSAYGNTVNRAFHGSGLVVTEGLNVHLAPDGYRLTRWRADDMQDAWDEYVGHLIRYWRQQAGHPWQDRAIASICSAWPEAAHALAAGALGWDAA